MHYRLTNQNVKQPCYHASIPETTPDVSNLILYSSFGDWTTHIAIPSAAAIAGWVAAEKKAQCTVQPLSKQGCEKSISVLSGWPDPNDAA